MNEEVKEKNEYNNFDEDFLSNESEYYDVQAMLEKNKSAQLADKVKLVFDKLEKKDRARDSSEAKSFDEVKEYFELKNRVVETFRENVSANIKIKKNYSIILIFMLGIQFLVLDGIFIFVGKGKLNYVPTTLNLFLSIGFLELIGLVTIIVKYIFAENINETLKIIFGIESSKK